MVVVKIEIKFPISMMWRGYMEVDLSIDHASHYIPRPLLPLVTLIAIRIHLHLVVTIPVPMLLPISIPITIPMPILL